MEWLPAAPCTMIRLRAGLALAALGLASGCMTANLQESRSLDTHIARGEAVVLLAKPHVEGTAAEDDFMDCVGQHMAKKGIRVEPNEVFQDSLFPWFEPSTAPQRPEGLSRLLARPKVRQRIDASGVRYIVWVDGTTSEIDHSGSMSCAAGPGFGGCLGFVQWEKKSDYDAVVWDLKEAKTAGSVSTTVTGTSAMVGVIVPLPFVARVQGTACDRLAEQLGEFLQGSDGSAASSAGG